MPSAHHRSSAWPLAAAFAGLIVYASLYPFDEWRWPPVADAMTLLRLPWPRFSSTFDIVSNLIGYMPLGLLLYGAQVRSGGRWPRALLSSIAASSVLSYLLELTQYTLPGRVPSIVDWLMNTAGAALGVLVAVAVQATGGVDRWQGARDRWLIQRSAGALALLLLWPFGLLFPAPMPFGLGPPWDRLLEGLDALIENVPWLVPLSDLIAARMPAMSIDPASEWLAVALGLLAPILLAYSIARPGWRRAVMACGAVVIGFLVTTLSTALNFGPSHATAWLTTPVAPATLVALTLALLLAPASQRLAAALGLVVLSALLALVVQAPADAYFAQSLQAWEQGRFIRFHGLAQWVGWLWPPATIGWLLTRIAAQDET